MCAVSVLIAYAQRVSLDQWTLEQYRAFEYALEPTMDFDRAMGEPDCPDPEKKAWLDRVRKKFNPSS